MKSYLTSKTSIKISQLSNNVFCKNSLCPKDYKTFSLPRNSKPLKEFLCAEKRGKEIGSSLYMKKSKYRFLKTVNVTERFLYDQSSIEYCTKVNNFSPSTGDVFIVKDGAGNGLGQVAYYIKNDKFTDYISAGIISIKLKEDYKWYILAFLKSQHFKDYINVNTAQGSTIRHSKMVALDYQVPFPIENSKEIERYLSLLMKNLLNKEKEINIRREKIDEIIEAELQVSNIDNVTSNTTTINTTTKNNLIFKLRLDTGVYNNNYKKIENSIDNYKYGYDQINLDDIKSGSTPKVRIFNGKHPKYLWVTPTDIQDEGFYNPIERISMPTSNNIKEDCILLVNRTSKGSKGEFVGIACFYDHSYYGDGHHNQGAYRVSTLSRDDLLFSVAFMNCKLMRKYCGCVSLGSKMKEMKSKDFSEIKFPKFPKNIKDKIVKLYFNQVDNQESMLTIDNYMSVENTRNKSIGIFQLNKEIIELKEKINNTISSIIDGMDVVFDFHYQEKLKK